MFFVYSFFLKQKSIFVINQKEKDLQFQSELANSQIEIREQTLSYIGQELHDDVGQKLSVVKILINQLACSEVAISQQKIKEANEILGEAIQDIRNLSKTYISEQVEHFGFIDSLEREIRRIKKLKLIKVHFHCNNHDVDIQSKHALILFRIAQ
jgi:signal transduction histidine kinase